MITHGYSGMVGDQFVFRVRGGKSMLCAKPVPSTKPRTQAQIDQGKRFTGAVHYAQTAMADPAKKAVYEARATKDLTAYNVAAKDFLSKPWIDQIDAIDYTGHAGDKIRVIASDNVKAISVNLSVTDAAGNVLETAACVYDDQNLLWIYTCTTAQAVVAGLRLIAVARDLPGHVTEQTLTL